MKSFLDCLTKVIDGEDLSEKEAFFALNEIAKGSANDFQVAAFLSALKTKGETQKEIAGFVKSVRSKALKVNCSAENLVDTAGTGGDKSGSFNVSTAAAFVASGAGAVVAKHGNRAVSGKTGSADVLEELKVNINVPPQVVQRQLQEIEIAFLFAPSFHPAFKRVAMVRKELGFKTAFNLVGPISNPANAKRQLVGVYGKSAAEKVAGVLKLLGVKKALVVSSDMDEISVSAKTLVFDVSKSGIKKYFVSPTDFGLKFHRLKEIRAVNAKDSARKILGVLNGENGACREIVLLNAAAAIFASGVSDSFSSAISLAQESIDSGAALQKLHALRADF